MSMRSRTGLLALVAIAGALAALAQGAGELPSWAFPMNPPDAKPPADDGVPRRVPGSDASYSLTQISDPRAFIAPDWHPQEHPAMPRVVAEGRRPAVFPCAFCHRADGSGGPESANLNGLPAAYIAQQMAAYRSGTRSTSAPQRAPQALMVGLAKAASDDEIAAAAAYFAQLPPKQNIRVVETADVPRTSVVGWVLVPTGSGEESIGQRVVEVPEDPKQFQMRDTHARFIAYVPPGSLARGEALVRTGGAGRTVQCASCHGDGLRGAGAVPPLAGRSPSYLARQLHDFRTGARTGETAQPMKPSVAKLTDDDIVAIVAYIASLKP
ncbi:MAG: c-type cytochrome [Ramlibacter sp.]